MRKLSLFDLSKGIKAYGSIKFGMMTNSLKIPEYMAELNESMMEAGARLKQPAFDPRYKLLFREADLEEGEAILRDGFVYPTS